MAEKGSFKKKLSLLDLTLLGMGSIIGSGWLFGAYEGAQYAGNLAWIAWLFGAFAIILIGLVYAELSAAMPRTGGFVRYPQYTHGSLVGWFIGIAAMLGTSSTAGVETDAFRTYATGWWPALGTANHPSVLGILAQIAFLFLFFLINYWSVQFFGKVNTVVTIFKFIVPICIMIFLLMHMHVSNFSVGGQQYPGIKGILEATTGAGIVFSFLGFRQAVDFGAEAARPQRDIPLAIIFSVLIGLVMYLILQFAFLGAVPHHLLSNGWAHISFDEPYANVAEMLGMAWLANLVFADAVISPSGTGNIYMSATARVIFAWARRGLFYNIFTKVHKKSGIPRPAMWLSFLLSIIWILPVKNQIWGVLVSSVTSATVLTYMFGPISIASLRKTSPDMERPFYLKGMSIISPLAFVFATWIIFWSGWSTDSLIIGVSLGSLILYFAFMDRSKQWRSKLKADWSAGWWLIIYYVFLMVMSRIGSFVPKNIHIIIHSPWDSIIVGIGALIIYYWGINSGLKEPVIDTDDPDDPVIESLNLD